MSLKGDNVSEKCAAVLRCKSADPGIVNVFTYRPAVLQLTPADSSKCLAVLSSIRKPCMRSYTGFRDLIHYQAAG